MVGWLDSWLVGVVGIIWLVDWFGCVLWFVVCVCECYICMLYMHVFLSVNVLYVSYVFMYIYVCVNIMCLYVCYVCIFV